MFDVKFQKDNPFERTILHAISLGGDTDTIATMAGAIAGAYYGLNRIPLAWITACEGSQDALKFGQQFYNMCCKAVPGATSESSRRGQEHKM